MALEWFACRGSCSGSDPLSDTVKVDAAVLVSGKENQQPVQCPNKVQDVRKEQDAQWGAQEEFRWLQEKQTEERRQLEETRRRREEDEAARCREEQAAAHRAASERAAAERAALEAAEELAAIEAAAVVNTRAEEERRLEVARSAEVKAQMLEENRLAQATVDAWCKANGFNDMNSKKSHFMRGTKFPLHEAVARRNEDVVGLMIQVGVDRAAKNSKGQTAEDLARKLNKGGSMDGVLAMLR
jgi:membrane protein involved in colicin uptake